MNLEPLFKLVENAISDVGVDPKPCRRGEPGQWNMRKGSARIWLDLWHIEEEGRAYFQVMSPVVPVPEKKREAFFEEILTVTDRLFGVAFTLYDGWAWIKSIREVDDMSKSEAKAMIIRVGNYADHYDNLLIDKYDISLGESKSERGKDTDSRSAPKVPQHSKEDRLDDDASDD